MFSQSWTRNVSSLAIPILLFTFSSMAAADCTKSKVVRLAKQGNTIAAIAETCDMETDEVKEIVETAKPPIDTKPTQPESGTGTRGTPVGQCGCWGPANPSQLQPHPMCKSGFARPSQCNAMCPAGGYMWQGVCS
jgi:hypothetical protein